MTGQQLEPIGSMPFEELVDVYKQQVRLLAKEGVDLFAIETMMSLQECRAALLAVKETCDIPASGQLKKYKVTINDLLAENEQLEARVKASEKGKIKDTMERAKLESELKDIQRLVDRIPPEVLAELKRQQRHTRER